MLLFFSLVATSSNFGSLFVLPPSPLQNSRSYQHPPLFLLFPFIQLVYQFFFLVPLFSPGPSPPVFFRFLLSVVTMAVFPLCPTIISFPPPLGMFGLGRRFEPKPGRPTFCPLLALEESRYMFSLAFVFFSRLFLVPSALSFESRSVFPHCCCPSPPPGVDGSGFSLFFPETAPSLVTVAYRLAFFPTHISPAFFFKMSQCFFVPLCIFWVLHSAPFTTSPRGAHPPPPPPPHLVPPEGPPFP